MFQNHNSASSVLLSIQSDPLKSCALRQGFGASTSTPQPEKEHSMPASKRQKRKERLKNKVISNRGEGFKLLKLSDVPT